MAGSHQCDDEKSRRPGPRRLANFPVSSDLVLDVPKPDPPVFAQGGKTRFTRSTRSVVLAGRLHARLCSQLIRRLRSRHIRQSRHRRPAVTRRHSSTTLVIVSVSCHQRLRLYVGGRRRFLYISTPFRAHNFSPWRAAPLARVAVSLSRGAVRRCWPSAARQLPSHQAGRHAHARER